MQQKPSNLLALDVGEVRIGVAHASRDVGIPQPLTTVAMGEEAIAQIVKLAEESETDTLVVGLPRSLHGSDTDQTRYVREFANKLEVQGFKIIFQDEALTSKRAEAELKQRKSRRVPPTVDELAATYILEDYLGIHSGEIT